MQPTQHPCFASRGFSLLETLISATLVLLVLGLGAHFLIPLLRMQVKGTERAELQQRAAILLEELRRDLARTNSAGVSLAQSASEMLLAIHPVSDLAQDGTVVWEDYLIVYQWSSLPQERTWRRGLWKDPSRLKLRASAPARLDEAALRSVASEAVTKRVTPGVTAVEFSHGGQAGLPVTLPLRAGFAFSSPSGEARRVARTLGGRLPSL